MYCTDFEYDGRLLSDVENIICCITESGGGLSTASIGSELTLNTSNNTATNKFRLISTQYDSAYTINFQIGKFGCNAKEYYYTEDEIVYITKWLCQKQYKKFKPIYEDGEYADLSYMGIFSINPIVHGHNVVGFDLTFTADAPYGYKPTIVQNYTFEKETKFTISNTSDEKGYLYMKMTISDIQSDGLIKLTNKTINKSTSIIARKGDIITIDGNTKIIESKLGDRDEYILANNFNYIFPKLYYDIRTDENDFVINTACSIELEYTPICKAGMV